MKVIFNSPRAFVRVCVSKCLRLLYVFICECVFTRFEYAKPQKGFTGSNRRMKNSALDFLDFPDVSYKTEP